LVTDAKLIQSPSKIPIFALPARSDFVSGVCFQPGNPTIKPLKTIMAIRNKLIWGAVILLGVVSFFLLLNRNTSTFGKKDRDFAVDDTASITRIFLADKRSNSVMLERQPNGRWMVNREYLVSKPIMDMFLQTLKRIEVKEPVPVSTHNRIISLLAANAVKVEVYQNLPRLTLFGKPMFYREKQGTVYYVGDATPDLTGTYMLREGSGLPFIIDMPGLRGFVAPRYTPRLNDWRDHTIFSHRLADIQELTLEIPDYADHSFRVVNHGNQRLELISLINNQVVERYDTLRVLAFMNSFGNIKFESLLNETKDLNIDSIRSSRPFHIIRLTDKAGKRHEVKTFRMSASTEYYDEQGNVIPWDLDRMYAEINEGKDFVLVQFFVFDKIIRPLGYFLKEPIGQSPPKYKP